MNYVINRINMISFYKRVNFSWYQDFFFGMINGPRVWVFFKLLLSNVASEPLFLIIGQELKNKKSFFVSTWVFQEMFCIEQEITYYVTNFNCLS